MLQTFSHLWGHLREQVEPQYIPEESAKLGISQKTSIVVITLLQLLWLFYEQTKYLKIITTSICIYSESLEVYIFSFGVQLDLFTHDMVISKISRNFGVWHVTSHHIDFLTQICFIGTWIIPSLTDRKQLDLREWIFCDVILLWRTIRFTRYSGQNI